jgi:diketogulonate reductase-like aldo/keto reductase
MTATREAVQANVTERCQRLGVNKVDLLQFHWQFVSLYLVFRLICIENAYNAPQYQDSQYLDVAKYLQEDERVGMLGLCNFDTEHMQRVIDSGVTVYSNQVQVLIALCQLSLVYSRET